MIDGYDAQGHQGITSRQYWAWLRTWASSPELVCEHEEMRTAQGFCALGMLAEVVDPTGWQEHSGACDGADDDIYTWRGIYTWRDRPDMPALLPQVVENALAAVNDDRGAKAAFALAWLLGPALWRCSAFTDQWTSEGWTEQWWCLRDPMIALSDEVRDLREMVESAFPVVYRG